MAYSARALTSGDTMRLISTTRELSSSRIARWHHYLINSWLAILRYAHEYGFKGAAWRLGLDRKTVRSCRLCWVASGPAGLVSHPPAKLGRRISDEVIRLIEQVRRELQFGGMRIQFWLVLRFTQISIARVIENSSPGLVRSSVMFPRFAQGRL